MLHASMRWGARVLLAVALMMVIDTACSHAPPPSTSPDVHAAAQSAEGKNAVARFHLTNGITYATSRFAVSDSFVVIHEILRDSKYYGPTSAHLYGKSDVTPPPKDATVPVKIPMSEIRAVEKWEPRLVSTDSTKGWIIIGTIVGALVAGLVIAINESKD